MKQSNNDYLNNVQRAIEANKTRPLAYIYTYDGVNYGQSHMPVKEALECKAVYDKDDLLWEAFDQSKAYDYKNNGVSNTQMTF